METHKIGRYGTSLDATHSQFFCYITLYRGRVATEKAIYCRFCMSQNARIENERQAFDFLVRQPPLRLHRLTLYIAT